MRRAARSCSSSSNGYASSAELSLGLSLGPSDANEEEQDEPEDVHLEEDLLRGIRCGCCSSTPRAGARTSDSEPCALILVTRSAREERAVPGAAGAELSEGG